MYETSNILQFKKLSYSQVKNQDGDFVNGPLNPDHLYKFYM